ncbi:hypothetical protein VT50_0228020 [Streptomyces antioxidans]|uniref:Uncharacterized protein n=1 Tax=Streptomyces antioxidans TaxID=1507734 RepID=A0A1V4CYN9_9ACTN|nr:hypothetical protein VT50_0228020 [Streptomyces antioxidans]
MSCGTGSSGTAQLFVACTQYAAATVTAAIRSGLFGERSAHRRVLVVSDPSTLPEVGIPHGGGAEDRPRGPGPATSGVAPRMRAAPTAVLTTAPRHPAGSADSGRTRS